MSFRSYDLYYLLRDFGQPVVLRTGDPSSSYDPETGTITSTDPVDHTVTGYFYNYDNMNIDQIVRGRRKCLISALDNVEPDTKDLIIANGQTVTVTSVTTIYSSGTAICHICHVEE